MVSPLMGQAIAAELPALTSERLLDAASRYDDIVIMSHNNPDPDAIGSGWALLHLIQVKLRKPVRFIAAGAIVRAENRKLISLLQPPLLLNDPVRRPARLQNADHEAP